MSEKRIKVGITIPKDLDALFTETCRKQRRIKSRIIEDLMVEWLKKEGVEYESE